jgi:dTDP-glucose 4,6-dehydratase
LEIAQRLCDLVDELRTAPAGTASRSLITHVADRPGHDRRYAIDASKSRRELGWRPEVSLAAGLRRTVEWYLANSQWIDHVTSSVFQRQRLGLASRGAS